MIEARGGLEVFSWGTSEEIKTPDTSSYLLPSNSGLWESRTQGKEAERKARQGTEVESRGRRRGVGKERGPSIFFHPQDSRSRRLAQERKEREQGAF